MQHLMAANKNEDTEFYHHGFTCEFEFILQICHQKTTYKRKISFNDD